MKIKRAILSVSFFLAVAHVYGADAPAVSLKIALVGNTARIGSEVRIRVTTKNVSQPPLTIAVAASDILYKVDFLDPAGKPVPKKDYFKTGSVSATTIPPDGERNDDLILGKMYDISQPGVYTVQVSRQSHLEPDAGTEGIKSNILLVKIEPKEGGK